MFFVKISARHFPNSKPIRSQPLRLIDAYRLAARARRCRLKAELMRATRTAARELREHPSIDVLLASIEKYVEPSRKRTFRIHYRSKD